MGNNLFGVDIAGIINTVVSPNVLDATLIVVTPGTRTAGDLAGGTNPVSTDYACKGFTDDYNDRQIDGTIILVGDRIITLIGDSISGGTVAPTIGDQITIEGGTWDIIRVKRDPDAATYECQVRPQTA